MRAFRPRERRVNNLFLSFRPKRNHCAERRNPPNGVKTSFTQISPNYRLPCVKGAVAGELAKL